MNNEEAKFRLRAYRSGGQDAGDATFGEALAHADRDPALRAWLAREQAFDAAVAEKLRAVVPPPGLREAILAGARVAPRRAFWRRPMGWAAAALFAGLVASVAFWRQQPDPDSVDTFARFALSDLRHGRHGGHGSATTALQTALANPATRLSGALPIDFSTLASSGCRTLRFGGRDVLEVCFERGGVEFHLYVTPRGDLPNLLGPRALAVGQASALAWQDARFAYVLAGGAGVEALRRLL
jgi:hypothetical protein